MGKYIVELKKNETLYKATTRESDGTAYVCSAIGTPYTAPDLEQIRKEAYEQGRKDGKIEGRAEVWVVARDIDHMSDDDIKACFECGFSGVFEKYTASEAIEKIKAWEDGKQKINVGDEVEAVYGKAVVIEILGNNKSVIYMYHNASTGVSGIDKVTKTGHHFTEIDSVLEKMRGEQDGKRREE